MKVKKQKIDLAATKTANEESRPALEKPIQKKNRKKIPSRFLITIHKMIDVS
jgi:hypothetical protein